MKAIKELIGDNWNGTDDDLFKVMNYITMSKQESNLTLKAIELAMKSSVFYNKFWKDEEGWCIVDRETMKLVDWYLKQIDKEEN